MKEAELQEALIGAASAAGWLVHHDRAALKADGSYTTAVEGHVGFPDLVLVHRRHPAMIVAELKGNHGRLSEPQGLWLHRFAAAGVQSRLWSPASYDQALDEITHPERVASSQRAGRPESALDDSQEASDG